MNKIKQILIGAGILALSGNAAAIMINDSSYDDVDSLIPVIQGILDGDIVTNITQKREARLARNLRKYIRSVNRLDGDLVAPRQERVTNRVERRGNKMMKIASKLQYPGTSTSNIEDGGECEGDCNGSLDVPEPSTIALLGLGLVGIGAARRLRKKAG